VNAIGVLRFALKGGLDSETQSGTIATDRA